MILIDMFWICPGCPPPDIYTYISYVYMYIYREREIEREREIDKT